ncbi:alpha-galactosidase [Phycicoccus sp. BSK3Z-2]|uniref:alpha-galactosidase n=1 Tax=Phycicoccus avicenniae TaxID=2828860 RepID=A0A941D9G5_9MICO|nr:alpha-galactosidase [Phycicoccus avicenniae]MBR7744564.1 alpha-galactosidase [Phycicoccus avicenniae]
MPLQTSVHLRSGGVSVVLDVDGGCLPTLLHWGADLGPLDADAVADLRTAGVSPVLNNAVDVALRLALVPETWTGWAGRPGLLGSRGGRDWSPRFEVTGVRVDGAEVTGPLTDAGTALVEVEAQDVEAGLGLLLRVELLVGGLLRVAAEVVNHGDDDYAVHGLATALPVPTAAREVLDLAGRWALERVPQRRALTVGTHLRESRRGRTGPDAATVLHVGEPGFSFDRGEVWSLHVAWSGNHVHAAERTASGEQVLSGGELLLPGEVVLAPGERYATPWSYGAYGVGLDAVASRFHTWLRSRPQHPTSVRPVTLNVWEAVYFDHRLEPLVELADVAAAIGVERFVLDDGWFGGRRDDTAGLGDWIVSPDVWPDGLHPLVDHVTGLGMQFGLWFEPEMVNLDSDVARAHPEWVMAPTAGRLPEESRTQQVLDLGIPECYAYVRDAVSAVLAEYDVSYVKWDHNRDLVEAGDARTGLPGVHAQTLAVYRLLDELRARHPGVEIESCSSGGARVDLEVLQRTERVWASDCIDPLDRQVIQRWTTQLVPPEMVGAHVASERSHTTGRRHDLGFRAATAVFGHLGLEWDLREASPEDREELAAWIALHKEHRDVLHGGTVVRVDHPDDSVVVGGVVAPDGSKALYSVATVRRPTTGALGRLRLPGLDPDRRYRVRPVNPSNPAGLKRPAWWGDPGPDGNAPGVVLAGRALAVAGLVAAPTFPEQAVVYLAEAVAD